MIRLGRQQTFHIAEASGIAPIRRAGALLTQQLGFDEVTAGKLALVITEAATNIVKHATQGQILLRSLQDGKKVGVEVIAIDAGPGISNIKLQMEDGHSTTGTYGVGLGAIERIAHEFGIYSVPSQGTVILMIIWSGTPPPITSRWQVGAVCIPIEGEDVCGDAWDIEQQGSTLALVVADGLGHGPDAAKASVPATQVIIDHANQMPAHLMQRAHAALHGTRGAAVAITQIDEERGTLSFAGIGNIAVSVFENDKRRHMISHNGIVGHNMRKVQEFAQPWVDGSLLIAHSDGLGTRWDLEQYPQLMTFHPSIVAAVLYRDFTRGRDDSTVVVLRDACFDEPVFARQEA